ncbi:MAG: hypothetical protein HY647_06605 [Acidobacteria bacterium]|nr:hypothetical protein [Acidobacteriota bacterium]
MPERPQRFLNRLRPLADAGEALRAEQLLALGRTFLAVGSLVAIYLDPSEPTRYAPLAYTSLLLYVLYSVAVLFALRARQECSSRLSLVLHVIDLIWPAYLTTFTEGPNSPFFPFFFFVLLAAAYRWGFRETLVTTVAAVSLILFQALLLSYGPGQVIGPLEGRLQLNRLIVRPTYLLLLGFLAGYLAEAEKELRAETSAISRVMGKAQVEAGLQGTIHAVLEEFLHLFAAEQVLLVLKETNSGNIYLWELKSLSQKSQTTAVSLSEVPSSQEGVYFFPTPGDIWYAIWRGEGKREEPSVIAQHNEGRWLRDASLALPEKFQSLHSFSHSLLGASFYFRREWMGWVYLLDARLGASPETELWFAQNLVRRALPAIYNVYLLRRLRSRVGTIERARVARELHDGVMQSLSAAVMRLDLLRRQKGGNSSTPEEELANIQLLLRDEMVKLRELMEQMRPLEISPTQLLDYLSELVEKFHRETGVNAQFICDSEEVTLRPRVCREVGRIVQEALVNVRRHSGAKNVVVSLTLQDGNWKLVIDDDGRGFPFSGRFTQAELDDVRKGPLVIKERVRSIRGDLTVDSTPARGARLEILIPQKVLPDKF